MKNRNKIALLMLIGLTFALTTNMTPLTSYNSAQAQEHEEETEVKLTAAQRAKEGIVISKVQIRSLSDTVNAPGEITANLYASSQITSRISAQVIARHVKMGDNVEAGQELVTLSSVDMAEAQGNLRLTQLEWQRIEQLGSDIVSARRYLEAKVQAQQAMAKVLAFGLTMSQAEEIIVSDDAALASGQYSLYSQQSGTIIEDDFVIGQFVDAGQPLLKISNEKTLWVEAQLAPDKAAGIERGVNALITRGHTQINGTVVQVHHIVNEESRTIAVRAEFDNSSDLFHAGEFVNILLQEINSSPTLAVPDEAITLLEGNEVVFKLLGDEFQPIIVETGRTIGGWTEIVSGIQASDEIVTENLFFIKSLILKSKIGDEH